MTNDQAIRSSNSGSGAHAALVDMLRTHGDREGAALSSYQRLAEESDDEGLRFLVRLIMADRVTVGGFPTC